MSGDKVWVNTDGGAVDGFSGATPLADLAANIPLDRAIGKANHIRLAFAQETKFWQSVSLLLGFSEWDLNMKEKDKKKTKFGDKMKWKKRKLKKRKLK